jgi:hypothetical protein
MEPADLLVGSRDELLKSLSAFRQLLLQAVREEGACPHSQCCYEGHVPHTGRARTQELAPVSKRLGALEELETHQPLKF